ncbi:NAD(P)/FAD-dependent oxidoreductase [Synechococcus elongatus]|uniref:NAD(P)/FAD-dependent oxidoreductase n=1 Tax=Synechococcus elongatus TaxID=32046 RepID=UPI000F7E59E9|nr:FAD-dependent oxidoreductase [Synechococcus elongatus]
MSESLETLDAIVVGAGWAGLTCARSLQAAGWTVQVLEKSRGWGGRAARRRLELGGFAEHGLPALAEGWSSVDSLIALGRDRGLLELWQADHWHYSHGQLEPRSLPTQWMAQAGLSGLARAYGEGLSIEIQQQVNQVTWQGDRWCVQTEQGDRYTARYLGLFVPAPQAEVLVPAEWQPPTLASVSYDPCITVITTYGDHILTGPTAATTGWAIAASGRNWRWLGLDSSKRQQPSESVCVLHSSAAWAEAHFDDVDLGKAGQALLQEAATDLAMPLLSARSLQVHRWRYALPQTSVADLVLRLGDRGVCGGDWCSGGEPATIPEQSIGGSTFVARAIASGQAGAQHLLQAD